MTSRAELLAQVTNRKPRTATLRFAVDATDHDRLTAARRRVLEAQYQLGAADGPARERAEQKLAAAEAAVESILDGLDVIEWHMAGIGERAVQALRAEHPPTDEQVERVAAESPGMTVLFNAETYIPALIAACTTSVVLPGGTLTDITADEVEAIVANWPSADVELLATTAARLDRDGTSLAGVDPKG